MELRKGALYALGERQTIERTPGGRCFDSASDVPNLVLCLFMHQDFVVRVSHGDKPLQGVSVWVGQSTEGNANKLFSGVTAADGTVHVVDLPPGEYWLNAELLGIVAGTECFQVVPRPTRKAKKKVR